MINDKPVIRGVHASACTIDVCRLCHAAEDLRFGVCFDCAELVDGKVLENGTHVLWDKRDTSNTWMARE